MNDGTITFSTELDNRELEKQLQQITKKINSLHQKIYQKQKEKMPLIEQAKMLGVELDAAKAKLFEMQNAPAGAFGKNQISEQKENVRALEAEWGRVQSRVEACDRSIQNAKIAIEVESEKAGALSRNLAGAGISSEKMDRAVKKADKSMGKFVMRLREVVRSALIFTLITQVLAQFREWLGSVIKTNAEATASIAKLKGALLTLAQPIVDVIVPAFIVLINILTRIVSIVANLVSRIFGTSAKASADAAKSLNDQQNALEGVGGAAADAGKSLASFDEINKLSGDNSSGGAAGASAEISPDFSEAGNLSWLGDTLGDAAGWVTAALLLGGIAMIAIGACTGSLGLILAGALAIGAGYVIGEETGVLQDWAKVFGLERVSEFITPALMLTGIALIAIGAMLGRLGLVLAGAALLAIGIVYGAETGELKPWAEKLGLDSVLDYVLVAAQLVGIVLIAIGAALGNIGLVIAGAALIAVGVAGEAIGEETLKEWWKVLKLTTVQQWVGVVTLLAGIALIAIGVALSNIVMVLGGMALLAIGTATSASEGNLKDWVTVLGLEKVVGWVTAALLLGGIALIVYGIVTANALMVLAGLGLLGAGVAVGVTSGTFSSWLETIVSGLKELVQSLKEEILEPIEEAFSKFYNTVVSIIEAVINGFVGIINGFIRGINKVIDTINEIPGVNLGTIRELDTVAIPRLATGAVIPPNREFMAVLGDQKSGTNIEAPLDTIVQAVMLALSKSGYSGGNGENVAYLYVGDDQFGKLVYQANRRESNRIGVTLVEGNI